MKAPCPDKATPQQPKAYKILVLLAKVMFDPKKFEGKYKGKKINRKSRRKEKLKKNKKEIWS